MHPFAPTLAVLTLLLAGCATSRPPSLHGAPAPAHETAVDLLASDLLHVPAADFRSWLAGSPERRDLAAAAGADRASRRRSSQKRLGGGLIVALAGLVLGMVGTEAATSNRCTDGESGEDEAGCGGDAGVVLGIVGIIGVVGGVFTAVAATGPEALSENEMKLKRAYERGTP